LLLAVRLPRKPTSAGSFDAERLLSSFQRITGKSFGEIPMNPFITSDSRAAAAATQRYRELLDTWAAWWDWMPRGTRSILVGTFFRLKTCGHQ
jgi:hypothetical protein